MTDLVTDEAVDIAYRAYCEARKGRPLAPGEYEATYSRIEVEWLSAALNAATVELRKNRAWWKSTCLFWNESCTKAWQQRDSAAFSVKQLERQLTDLRAGIEALRDEWRLRPGADYLHDHAAALDALLRGAKS